MRLVVRNAPASGPLPDSLAVLLLRLDVLGCGPTGGRPASRALILPPRRCGGCGDPDPSQGRTRTQQEPRPGKAAAPPVRSGGKSLCSGFYGPPGELGGVKDGRRGLGVKKRVPRAFRGSGGGVRPRCYVGLASPRGPVALRRPVTQGGTGSPGDVAKGGADSGGVGAAFADLRGRWAVLKDGRGGPAGGGLSCAEFRGLCRSVEASGLRGVGVVRLPDVRTIGYSGCRTFRLSDVRYSRLPRIRTSACCYACMFEMQDCGVDGRCGSVKSVLCGRRLSWLPDSPAAGAGCGDDLIRAVSRGPAGGPCAGIHALGKFP